MHEAVSQGVGKVKGEDTFFVALKKEVEFSESVKTAANNETFQVLLNVGGCLVHSGLDSLILVKLGHKVDFHAGRVVYLRLKGE